MVISPLGRTQASALPKDADAGYQKILDYTASSPAFTTVCSAMPIRPWIKTRGPHRIMNIGTVRLDNPTVLAPLAGITNLSFRLMIKQAGCGLVVSEMVSANGLVYKSQKTKSMLATSASEKPVSIQIFGTKPDIMAEAAQMVEASGADIIDINFGCSVKKILKNNSGAALMQDLDLAKEIIKRVRDVIRVPLTIKMRSGWDPSGNQALALCKIAESCGVDAVAIHPRTATQGFRGFADWSVIKKIQREIRIPVIGNGDIVSPEDAVRMLEETGCDAVMVGRASISNPLIFNQIHSLLAAGNYISATFSQRFDMMRYYLSVSIEQLGEHHACHMMRSRLGWFSKGLPGAAGFRQSITRIRTRGEAEQLIDEYEKSIGDRR